MQKFNTIVSIKNPFFFVFSLLVLSSWCTSARAQAPVAEFTADVTAGCAPIIVRFTDQSTNTPTSWLWDFGNGVTSVLQNPTATYFTPGTYTITLTATNASGNNTIVKTGYITVNDKPSVNFTADDSTGCFPFRVQFTDLSTAGSGTVVDWLWDFGDGNTSTLANPVHTYNATGNYTVSLRITNSANCFNVFTKPAYIQVPSGVVADFTNSIATTCNPPASISFSNTTTGPGTLTYQWFFGDGGTSTTGSPTYIYTTPGTFTVTLIATSSGGCIDTITQTNAITIGAVTSQFQSQDSACAGTQAIFTNTTNPLPTVTTWFFGDGASAVGNAVNHVYTVPGNYVVSMINQYANCTDSATRPIRVLASPTAAFSGNNLVACRPPLTVNFSDASANAIAWLWDFGDGNTSALQNPAHTYTGFGQFDVLLRVTNPSGCTDTLRRPQYVRVEAPTLAVSNLPAQGCIPFNFTPAANITAIDGISSYFWDFGDGFTSTAANPSHIYTTQGTYNFKLRITTVGGCTDSLVVVNAVTVGTIPTVNFSATPLTVCAFQPVTFTDLSAPADTWQWSFGDGANATVQNPTHIYQDTGLFTVTLIATNSGCSRQEVKLNYIRVLPPVAQFRDSTDCQARRTKYFINTSRGGVTYLWDFGDGFTSTAVNPVHTYAANGTYTVSLTATNGACTHTIQQPVRVIIEAADFTVSATTACRRTPLTFNAINSIPANVGAYTWSFGDGATATGVSASHIYQTAGLYTVRLIVTDLNGCVDSMVRTNLVRINGATANFGSATNIGCANRLVSFADSSITDGVNPITQWTWHFGDGAVQSYSSGPFTHSYPGPGVYDVKLVVRDAAGCVDSVTLAGFVTLSSPAAKFYSPDTVSCPGSSVSFTDTSVSGPIISKFWDFGNGTTSLQGSVSVNTVYFTPGLYTVKLRITDNFGCSDSITKLNYIRIDTPRAAFSMSDSLASCPPLNVQFTYQGGFESSVRWDFGDGSFSTLLNPAKLYSTPGTYFPRLIVTSPGGCRDTTFKRVVISGPYGSVSYTPLAGCGPLTVNFQATTNGTTSTLLWDFNNGFTVSTTDTTISYIYPAGGRFVPRIIMGDPAGCLVPVLGLDTILVEELKANFGASAQIVCDSAFVQFSDSSTSIDSINTYFWDFGDGFTSTQKNPFHQYTAAGNYSVKLRIGSPLGCVDSTEKINFIRVTSTPQVEVFGDTTSCEPGNFFLQGIITSGDTTGLSWEWKFSTGEVFTTRNVNISYPNPGSYSVTLYGRNASGCVDSVTRSITVHPNPVVNAGNDTTVCAGTPLQLQASGALTYFWLPPSDGTLSCTACPNPLAAPPADTLYIVRGRTIFGCEAVDTMYVKVMRPYTLTVAPAVPEVCLGKSLQLTASGGQSYSWTPATGLSNANIANPLASPPSTTTYTVSTTDSLNCFPQSVPVTVTILPLPTVNAGPDQTIAAGGTATLNAVGTGGINNFLWRPAGSLNCSTCATTVASPKATTSYIIRSTSPGGCVAQDTVTVFVVCDDNNFFVPNTFSPNGDGMNDVFYPRGKGIDRVRSMIIYNRWGERVYEKREFGINDPSMGWNGRLNGKLANADVYTYFIEIICDNNNFITYKGNVTLIQ